MNPNTLKTVLETERQIQEVLAGERIRAARWLEQVAREVEEDRRIEADRLVRESARALEAARNACRDQAARILARSQAALGRAEKISDDVLHEIVRRHLAGILPERRHDRPDVQG